MMVRMLVPVRMVMLVRMRMVMRVFMFMKMLLFQFVHAHRHLSFLYFTNFVRGTEIRTPSGGKMRNERVFWIVFNETAT